MAGDPSQPKNLEQVLRMAVENSGSSNESMGPMTDERRQFLQGILGSISGSNPVERMKVIVSHCATTDGVDRDALYEELEELMEWCEDLDVACDFHKIGGFQVLDTLLTDEDEGIRWRCGDLIAALCQNNPYCQEKLLQETDLMSRLMSVVECVSESEPVQTKALYALSGFLRGNPTGQDEFVKKDGFSLLLKAMQHHGNKICTKASFLIMALMKDQHKFKDDLTKMGFVEHLAVMLSGEHRAEHEHIMAALLELTTDCQTAVLEALRPELDLQRLLSSRISLLKNRPESEEELDYTTRLKQLLDSQMDSGLIDR